jgi:hypothetical protein
MRVIKYVPAKAVFGSLFLTSLVGGVVAGLELTDPFICSLIATTTFNAVSMIIIAAFGYTEDEKIKQSCCRVKTYLGSCLLLLTLLTMSAYGIAYGFDVILGMACFMLLGPIGGGMLVFEGIVLSLLQVNIWDDLLDRSVGSTESVELLAPVE